jgi:pimeloyl-ACP methyl ester carboxylesterase
MDAKSTRAYAQTGQGTEKTRADPGPRARVLAGLPVIDRRLPLAGIPTAVLEGGDGPPLVLLHGPAAYAAHWQSVIPDLVKTHRVIVPDLPGHGESGAGDDELNAASVVAWLGELIEHTCASPPVLVGQLLGGAIAARYAIERGATIHRLVLVDTFGLRPLDLPPSFAAALSQYLSQPSVPTHEQLWRHCAHDLDSLRERMAGRWRAFEAYNIDRARGRTLHASLGSLLGHFGAAIPDAELRRLSVPASLVWGRHDRAVPVAVAEETSARYGWPLHVIEDSADDPPVEQPLAFLRALRTVLA